MIPPSLLAELKAFLGIPPADTTQDVWLTSECEVILAEMRQVTGAWLYPPAICTDTFVIPSDPCNPCAAGCGCACPPVQAKELPATKILDVTYDGVSQLLALFTFGKDGTLLFTANRAPVKVSSGITTLNYEAGYADLPAELKGALFNLVGASYNASGRGTVQGVIPTGVTKMTIIDVGSVEYADAASAVAGGNVSPILGRYTGLLTPYLDKASQLGSHPCRESNIDGPVVLVQKPVLSVVEA